MQKFDCLDVFFRYFFIIDEGIVASTTHRANLRSGAGGAYLLRAFGHE